MWGTVAIAVVALALLGSAGAGGTSAAPATAGTLSTASSDTFNFQAAAIDWNAGNLCHVHVSGSSWTCDHSGNSGRSGCGCDVPLSYNFSANNTYISIDISQGSGHSPGIYLNIHGKGNTINLTWSGCSGGTLNVSVLGQDNVLNFHDKVSGGVASIAFYTDSDTYNAWIGGSHNTVTTDFSGAFVLKDICPGRNQSSSDVYAVTIGGWSNSQTIVYANAVGYNTAANTVSLGWGNAATFENTTSFTCSWSLAPSVTCTNHGGWGPSAEIRRPD